MKADTLQNLLGDHIKDLYNAETQLVKAFLQMENATTSPNLRRKFYEHLAQMEGLIAAAHKIRDHETSGYEIAVSTFTR